MQPLFSDQLIDNTCRELGITDLTRATIGQMVLLATYLQQSTGIDFIRMDQGVPGLSPELIGRQAEQEALKSSIAAMYPPAEGVPPLKQESSRFIKAFLDIDIAPQCCIPVVGAVQGSYAAFVACNQLDARRRKILFIDPGFPIQKSQLRIIGGEWEAFDIFHHRGAEKLREKVESFLVGGEFSAIIYSNPNNPAWTCLTEDELRAIGELATKYDAIVLEDLAYFGMDFRSDFSQPFAPPYPPTVARYTDNYILMLSASKIFSYAGQRIAVSAISPALYNRIYPLLGERYGTTGHFGQTLTASILYMITSGVTHSTQWGLAAMFAAASDGELNFIENTREYSRRAERMKAIFRSHGFTIVYYRDDEREVGDGFFFTIGYPGLSGGELMRRLVSIGISSISLATTGSEQEGIRACCSRMTPSMFDLLDERLAAF